TQLLGADEIGNSKNPQAVEEVKAGRRMIANAAWWGFDEEDATEAIQSAINSGAKTVILPNLGKDWIVRPLRLAGHQELILEKGVVITAKRGEYRGKSDSVFVAQDIDNLTIRGEGATVRMQKEDYIVGLVFKDLGWNRAFGQYEKSEWRMCLAIRGCNNVRIEGLTLRDSGGDGIYIDGGRHAPASTDIHLKSVNCDNNYRQGLSVISVDGLLVEDSKFCNTWGTPPSAGIDIEPDAPTQHLTDIVIRNCAFEDNYGDGIEVHAGRLTRESKPISIVVENCRITSRRGAGIRILKLTDDGPKGTITFSNCTIENTEAYGIKVQDKSADAARISFVNCRLRNTANNRNYADAWFPIVLLGRERGKVKRFGGIEFTKCFVENIRDRAAVALPEVPEVFDLTGQIEVKNARSALGTFGEKPRGLALTVKAEIQ
ncbi:MAG: right-handed parallel beta-helix repeat-containing protein, partial [Planctomycetaceae bacterium]